MKPTNQSRMGVFLLIFLIVSLCFSQENQRPMYITVTTLHWDMDYENFDMDTWKAGEKEFKEKVTDKNEHIVGASYFTHRFTPDNREIVYVQAYPSWEAIDKASGRNDELIKEAWPDEDARKELMEKRMAYYTPYHSDEIYATMPNAKPYAPDEGKAKVLLVRKSHFAFPDDGSQEEFNAIFKEYAENVFHKNEHIKAYYPNVHAWGSDRTEFVEAFYVDSLDGLEKMGKRNNELFEEHWADEEGRKKMGKMARKYFTGVHGDYIYNIVDLND